MLLINCSKDLMHISNKNCETTFKSTYKVPLSA